MKPHPRIRKTVKWGGAVVSVLLVVVWIGSGWKYVGWASERGAMVGIGDGYLALGRLGTTYDAGPPGWRTGPNTDPFGWWFRWVNGAPDWAVGVPLWVLLIPMFIAALIAWRLDTLAHRRARLNLCPKCNYDRTGLAPGAICPECGTP